MSENRQNAKTNSRPMGPMRGPGGGHGPGGFGQPVEKPKNFKGTLRRLLVYLKPRKVSLILVLLFTIVSTSFMIYGPKLSAKAINRLTEGVMAKIAVSQIIEVEKDDSVRAMLQYSGIPLMEDAQTPAEMADALQKFIDALKQIPEEQRSQMTEDGDSQYTITEDQEERLIAYVSEMGTQMDFTTIGEFLLMMMGLYLLSSGFLFATQYIMSSVTQRTVFDIRRDVNEKLARLPLKFFDSRTHGEIMSRMTNDIDTISQTLQQNLVQVISSFVQIVGYIIMMLTISPILTLIVLATLPLYIIATMNIAKRSQKYFAAQQKELGALSGHVEEMYTGHKIVKAFGQEEKSVGKFKSINGRLYDAGWKAQFVSGIMFPLMNFISNLGYVLICVVGGTYAAKSLLELGDITAFIQYSRSFTQPIIQTANIANVIQSTIACAERVFELMDEQEQLPDKTDSAVLQNASGDIRFNSVDFGYTEDNTLIKDMNISVRPGQRIAIVGPTGAGKTTLVNLLMRFYEIKDGSITVDGVDTRDMRRGDLRHIFGMVLQDTWLFKGTIRDNIAYGRHGATEEEIVEAARAAHADHFIRTLPEGYDTVLNEEATNISQGQKQLLTIARAVLANPPILILDEATSNVDTRTEIIIQRAMERLMAGRTSFVIAHRLSTIRNADMILVMNHGTILEQGTHRELLEQGGFYADLYMSQFTGASADEEAV